MVPENSARRAFSKMTRTSTCSRSSRLTKKSINLRQAPQFDLSLNEFYGVALDNQEWTTLGEKQMLVGTASNANGVVMKLAAVKDLAHWNYKPEAAFIWDFFQDYQRNTENGELIINSSEE